MQAKKKYGQNFLIEDTIINNIVSLLDAKKNDLIIEIGPGRGALTQKLKLKGSLLLCYEIDVDMHKYLDKLEDSKCQIIYEDILKVDLIKTLENYNYDNLFIIGNLPYYITTPIIEKMIKSNIKAKSMVFMVQNEVADRLCSKCQSRNYGYMTVFVNHYYQVTKEIFVSKKAFVPEPKVDSAVIKFNIKEVINNVSEDYFLFIKEAFKLKRKKLKNNLKNYDWLKISKVLEKNGLSQDVRAEDLTEEIFLEIYKNLK